VSKVLAIIAQDMRTFLADRSNLPGLLLVPAVMTVIIALVSGGAFGGGAPTRRLDVLDADVSPASADLLSAIRFAGPGLVLCPMDNMPDDACQLGNDSVLTLERSLDRVAESVSVALLQIPAGYASRLVDQETTSITIRTANLFGPSQAAQQAVEAALRRINGAAIASQVGMGVIEQLGLSGPTRQETNTQRQAIYTRALRLWESQPVKVALTFSGSPEESSVSSSLRVGLGQSVPGMGGMFVLLTVFGGMAALTVERQQGTLPRLASMPVSRAALIGGKVLARFTLGLIQFLIVILVGAVLGMDFGSDPIALVLLIGAYTLAVTALSFAVGTRIRNPAQASGLALLSSLTLAPLGGAWWPIQITPPFMQTLGRLSPVAWLMEGSATLIYDGGRIADIWLPLVVLLALALVAFLIAIPRFRYHVD